MPSIESVRVLLVQILCVVVVMVVVDWVVKGGGENKKLYRKRE